MWFLTRQKRYFIGKILKLQNKMVVMRLVWALHNIEAVRKAVARGTARFGTVDAWLLFKMTGKHITDIGNASTTGQNYKQFDNN
jgi:glycerol kinase